MQTHNAIRTLRITTLAATLALLAACASNVNEEAPGESAHPPAEIPAAFNNYAIWSTPADGSVNPIATREETIVYLQPTGEGVYNLAAIDNNTGNQKWTGQPQEIPASNNNTALSLHNVTINQRDFTIASIPLPTDNALRLDIYDPNHTGDDNAPIRSQQFVGTDHPPTLTTTNAGIVITGVDGTDQYVYNPATGDTQLFIGTLDRTNGGQKVTETLWASYGTGVITTWANGGYTYRGTNGGWGSDDYQPTGAKEGTGSLLAANGGYILSTWQGSYAGQEVLTLQELLTGRVVATLTHTAATSTPDQPALRVARDGKWVAWHHYGFNVGAGTGTELPNTVTADSVNNGVIYGTHKNTPTALDLTSGNPIAPTPPQVLPVAFTDSAGIFTTTRTATATLFASTQHVVS